MVLAEDEQATVAHLDTRYLVNTLVELARIPTQVPLGPEVFMEPDDPKLVHYVQDVLRPKLYDFGVYTYLTCRGINSSYAMGRARLRHRSYSWSIRDQHHNLMPEPFSGKIAHVTAWGYDEPCVFGQGVTQNKAHHAVCWPCSNFCTSIRYHSAVLCFAVNNEGRSSLPAQKRSWRR